jgi:hopene-associated glycosyltransferase HpnB
MSDFLGPAAILALGIWTYLTLGHGRFWDGAHLLDGGDRPPREWPCVTAVIPARDEALFVGRAVRSLLDQDYPGPLHVVVVDDRSEDGTADAVRAALDPDEKFRVTIRRGQTLPIGWSGKLWAMCQGVLAAERTEPDYYLFTDADIAHHPTALRRLVARATARDLDLASLMVRLQADGFWGRLLVPAFVFFFQKLYPFPWVNDVRRKTAGAAGGCMLVRRSALERAGGLRMIAGALIDDCALAGLIKRNRGRLWLGLTDETWSLRPYRGLADVWGMVARTAYTQLRHSPLWLAATLAGLGLTYLAAPLGFLWGLVTWHAPLMVVSGATWLLMALCYAPTLMLYRQNPVRGLLLPLAAALYAAMTFDSARRHHQGRGGAWKGRTYARPV